MLDASEGEKLFDLILALKPISCNVFWILFQDIPSFEHDKLKILFALSAKCSRKSMVKR